MKKIGWRTITLFTISFLVMLLVAAPATLLSAAVEAGSKGQFVLANTSGTIWQGSATPGIRQRNGNLLALEKLHWKIAVLPLFTGKFICQFRWDHVEQDQLMTAVLSFHKIELKNALLPLHADILAEFSPFLQPVQLGGEMQIKSDKFTYSREGMSGAAVIEWTNAGSALSSVRPLGHYRINLAANGERLEMALVTISGKLLLEGKGSIVGHGVMFQGSARASLDSNGALDKLLNNFGPESAPGIHRINLSP